MVDHAVRLTDSGQEIAEATYARNRFFRTMPARRSMRAARKALPRGSVSYLKTNTKENKPMKLDQMPARTCRIAAPDRRRCR